MLIEYVDGMKNGYRLRDGEVEFKAAYAVAQNSPWRPLGEGELLMHKVLGTIVATWLDNRDEELWHEMELTTCCRAGNKARRRNHVRKNKSRPMRHLPVSV